MTDATVSRRTVNLKQAMRLTGVARRTVYNWIAAGKLTVLRTPGGQPRFYADELLAVGGARPPAVVAQWSQNLRKG